MSGSGKAGDNGVAPRVSFRRRQARQGGDHGRHHADLGVRLRARLRLVVRGGLRAAHLHPRDGTLRRRAPARPRRGRADLHSLRRRVDRDEGHAARRGDGSLRRHRRAARGDGGRARLLFRGAHLRQQPDAGRVVRGLLHQPVHPDPVLAVRRRAHRGDHLAAIVAGGRADPRRALLLEPEPDADPGRDPRRAPGDEGAQVRRLGPRECRVLEGEPRAQVHLRRALPRASRLSGGDVPRRARNAVPDVQDERDLLAERRPFTGYHRGFPLEDPMTISMYQASVPTIIRALNNLAAVLDKGQQHAEAKKIDPAVLIASRLYPDMLPLSKQVQIASDISKGGTARLAQIDPPPFEDNESTFPQLIERARKTIAFLETLKPQQIDGSEGRTGTWQTRTGAKSMQGMPYLLNHVLPNVFFHVTTAYDILRHNGVELGKQDFLGKS